MSGGPASFGGDANGADLGFGSTEGISSYTYDGMATFSLNGPRDIYQWGMRRAQIGLVAIAMKAHAAIAEATPVDTGYLRMSLIAAVDGEPAWMPPQRPSDAKAGQYVEDFLYSSNQAANAIFSFGPGHFVDIGFTANYAVYVEAWAHMVQQAIQQLPAIVAQVANDMATGAAR